MLASLALIRPARRSTFGVRRTTHVTGEMNETSIRPTPLRCIVALSRLRPTGTNTTRRKALYRPKLLGRSEFSQCRCGPLCRRAELRSVRIPRQRKPRSLTSTGVPRARICVRHESNGSTNQPVPADVGGPRPSHLRTMRRHQARALDVRGRGICFTSAATV